MKIYWNYKEEDSTLLLNQFLNGILPPGVYGGFDAVPFDGSMLLRLSQNNAVEEISIAGTSKKIGVIKTKQGVIVAEDTQVELLIDPTTTLPRIDIITIQHQYQAVINASIPFYSIIKGTPALNPIPPSLTIPAYQMKIGELRLPANCNVLNTLGVEWLKELSPILYRTPKTVVIAKSNNFILPPAVGVVVPFVNFTTDKDQLAEFNPVTGEFTAKNDGLYSITWQCRFDTSNYTTTPQDLFGVTIIFVSNPLTGAWEYANGTFLRKNIVGEIFFDRKLVNLITYLKKGQKLRCSIENAGTIPINTYDNDLYITRID